MRDEYVAILLKASLVFTYDERTARHHPSKLMLHAYIGNACRLTFGMHNLLLPRDQRARFVKKDRQGKMPKQRKLFFTFYCIISGMGISSIF